MENIYVIIIGILVGVAALEWFAIAMLAGNLKLLVAQNEMYKQVADDLHATTLSVVEKGLATLDPVHNHVYFNTPHIKPQALLLLSVLMEIEAYPKLEKSDYLSFVGNSPAGNALVLKAQLLAEKCLVLPDRELDRVQCEALKVNTFQVSVGPINGHTVGQLHTAKGLIYFKLG